MPSPLPLPPTPQPTHTHTLNHRYVDPHNASVLHALSHAGHYDANGGHAWSIDGGHTWQHHNDTRAYSSLITYTAGTFSRTDGAFSRTDGTFYRSDGAFSRTDGAFSRSVSRRERPHLVFDERGEPIALTNGVTDAWPCTYRVCPHDYCHTSLQRLNQRPR